MAVNAVATTTNYDTTRLDKANASNFTLQIANQSCYFQINAAPNGRGENWVPQEGALLSPGLWNFSSADWAQFGVTVAQGIRVKSSISTDPAVVTIY
jgi:hypothetical protein